MLIVLDWSSSNVYVCMETLRPGGYTAGMISHEREILGVTYEPAIIHECKDATVRY